MNSEDPQKMTLAEKANAAFQLASMQVIEIAKRTKTDIIIWRNGQTVRISPEEALADDAIDTSEPRSN